MKRKNQSDALWGRLECGAMRATVFTVQDGRERTASHQQIVLREETGRAEWLCGEPEKYRDDLYFRLEKNYLCCRRVFQNFSELPLSLNELGIRLENVDFGGVKRDDFFYHTENPRIYEAMTFPVDYCRTKESARNSEFDVQAGNRWADPKVICERVGRSPYQPFPAVVLGNYGKDHALVHGSLSQMVFYHNYLFRHDGKGELVWDIYSSFKATDVRVVQPGECLVDEWYLGSTEDSARLDRVFCGYTAELRRVLPPLYGSTAINRDSMVWGSWNDGIFRDVSEDLLVEQAAYLKKNFPTVRWMQLDDGYAVYDKMAHGLGMPYEGEDGVDHRKFPHGLRGYTDRIRAEGLRPAVWIGGFCPKETKIYREHPEWFLDYDYRVDTTAPLDVSQPAVREYMTRALDYLVTACGFEGVKHDFWSYAFEDSNDMLKNKERSGYEWREWWTGQMRRRLPSDGYFQTGCDIVMGNPFLAKAFTNYRYGIDIGAGNWENVKITYLWGMACFATHTGDLFVPNSDSVGLYPGLKEEEAMFALNYCLVTHSMVEISGLLSRHADSPRIPILKKAVCNPNNGQDVFYTHWDYRNPRDRWPAVLYFRTAHFCPKEGQGGLPLRTVGLFNLEDTARVLKFTAEELQLPSRKGGYLLRDVWSGKTYPLTTEFSCRVGGHASRLLAVCEADGVRLLDANVRVLCSERRGNRLRLQMDYACQEAELCFAAAPKSLKVNGRAVNAGRAVWKGALPEHALVEAVF